MHIIAMLRSMRMEESPTDAGTVPAVSTAESVLVVLEVLFNVEEDEELEVVEVLELELELDELELDELELVQDEDGVGLGLQVVEDGGGVQVVVGDGGGCQVLVGVGD